MHKLALAVGTLLQLLILLFVPYSYYLCFGMMNGLLAVQVIIGLVYLILEFSLGWFFVRDFRITWLGHTFND